MRNIGEMREREKENQREVSDFNEEREKRELCGKECERDERDVERGEGEL